MWDSEFIWNFSCATSLRTNFVEISLPVCQFSEGWTGTNIDNRKDVNRYVYWSIYFFQVVSSIKIGFESIPSHWNFEQEHFIPRKNIDNVNTFILGTHRVF